MFDTYNLRSDAAFSTMIAPNIYWIPYNTLGKSSYNNESFICYEDSLELTYKKVSNPYELIQFIQNNDFKRKSDNKYKVEDSMKWENHENGSSVLMNKCGGCATYSGFFYESMTKYFDDVYNFCVVGDNGWGHAFNYIKIHQTYYFCDIYAQLNEFSKYISIETGLKKDFVRARYITGCCYKTDSIDSFITFFLAYHRLTKRQFIFFSSKKSCIPSVAMKREHDILYTYIKSNQIIDVFERNDNTNIVCNLL